MPPAGVGQQGELQPVNKVLARAGLALMLCAPLPSLADVTSSATLSGYTVTLIDLNPGDGIAPSIDIRRCWGCAWGSVVEVSAHHYGLLPNFQQIFGTSFGVFGPTSASAQFGYAQASGSISGSLFEGGVTLTVTGAARGLQLAIPNYTAQAGGGGQSGLEFTLSPSTQAVFSGTSSLFAQSVIDDEYALSPSFLSEGARASVMLSVRGQFGADLSSVSHTIRADSAATRDPQTGLWHITGQTASESLPLQVSFANTTAAPRDGFLFAVVNASGGSSVGALPVPEPSTYALMLAGLATLVLRKQRERRGA
jgi:hypothetical protein